MGSGVSTGSAASVAANAMSGCFMATYKIQPSYLYSDLHHFYVDNLEKAKHLPHPHPPPTPREAIFNSKDFEKIDRRADQAPDSLLKEPYTDLIKYLMDGVKDDVGKVRVIYRWITSQQVDCIRVSQKAPDPSTPLYQIWRIKKRKGNYAQFVSILCRLAKIPCVIIHGKLKGSTYDVGSKMDDKQHYGEWNAVLIDNHWRLINAYWGACAVGSEGGDEWLEFSPGGEIEESVSESKSKDFMFTCDENYFLTDPRQLISTHLPFTPEWQLREHIITPERFEEMAFLKDRFFNMDMAVLSHPECVINSSDGEVELVFGIPEEAALYHKYYYLLFRQENKGVPGFSPRYDRYVFMHRPSSDCLSLKLRSPVCGTFRMELVGKDTRIKEPGYDYDWICLYKIIFHKAKAKCAPYPEQQDIGWGPGLETMKAGLSPRSHQTGFIQSNSTGEVEIVFDVKDKAKVEKLSFGGKLTRGGVKEEKLKDRIVHRIEDDKLIFNVNLPRKGEYSLQLNADEDGQQGQPVNFCNYMVSSDQKRSQDSYPQGFDNMIGKKPACEKLGLIPLSHPSGIITTETEIVQISFKRTKPIEQSVYLLGSGVVSQEISDDIITYTIQLSKYGNYGFKLSAKPEGDGGEFESAIDYVIQYKKKEPDETPVETPITPMIISLTVSSPSPSPSPGPDEDQTSADYFKKRIDLAVEAQDETELNKTIKDLKKFNKAKEKPIPNSALNQKEADQSEKLVQNGEVGDMETETNESQTKVIENSGESHNEANQMVTKNSEDGHNQANQKVIESSKEDHNETNQKVIENSEEGLNEASHTVIENDEEDHNEVNEEVARNGCADHLETDTNETEKIVFENGAVDKTESNPNDIEAETSEKESGVSKKSGETAHTQSETPEARSLGDVISTETAQAEIERAQREIDFIKMKKELLQAIEIRNLSRLIAITNHIKQKGCQKSMPEEMKKAKNLIDRLQVIQRLLHDVLELEQPTIAEIKGYSAPPRAVQKVLMATLLLLGNFEEETEDWTKIQCILGKTGKDSLKRRIEDLDLNTIQLDIALGAKGFLRDISLDQIRIVSAGAATFYVWAKGIIHEMETRHSEDLEKTRPRTRMSRAARKRKSRASSRTLNRRE